MTTPSARARLDGRTARTDPEKLAAIEHVGRAAHMLERLPSATAARAHGDDIVQAALLDSFMVNLRLVYGFLTAQPTTGPAVGDVIAADYVANWDVRESRQIAQLRDLIKEAHQGYLHLDWVRRTTGGAWLWNTEPQVLEVHASRALAALGAFREQLAASSPELADALREAWQPLGGIDERYPWS